MNYDLPRVVEGAIRPSITYAMPYGEMPPGMLIEKFEETDVGDEEDLFDNYARKTLTNWGPDTNRFEYEEPRGAVNRSAGMLQLRHNGHRGEAEDPYRPEYFDGFMGADDREPRGINTDPDMKEYVKQQQARLRFIRFTPDTDGVEQVTGGGRSEGMVMADNQKVFKAARSRLRIFDRQLDGRREGMRRVWRHKSDVPKQVLIQSYGDHIRDYALTPQRRANIITKQILRDSRAWYAETADADFAFARYAQICRRAQNANKMPLVATSRGGADSEFSDTADTKSYRAAALLMANIARGKKHIMDSAEGDIMMAESKLLAARKTAPFARDLAMVLQGVTADGDLSEGKLTQQGKTSTPQQRDHLARQITYNHLTPAHHYLNAELMYKSVKPGKDNELARGQIITDNAVADIRDTNTAQFQSAKRRILTGAKLNTTEDADRTNSMQTYNYRRALAPNGDKRLRNTSGDHHIAESDPSQRRRAPRQNYRAESTNDTIVTANFGDNQSKERRGRGVGNKYMTRFIERDAREGDIGEMGATSQ